MIFPSQISTYEGFTMIVVTTVKMFTPITIIIHVMWPVTGQMGHNVLHFSVGTELALSHKEKYDLWI